MLDEKYRVSEHDLDAFARGGITKTSDIITLAEAYISGQDAESYAFAGARTVEEMIALFEEGIASIDALDYYGMFAVDSPAKMIELWRAGKRPQPDL